MKREREAYQFNDLLPDDIFNDTSGFDGGLCGFARDVHHLLESVNPYRASRKARHESGSQSIFVPVHVYVFTESHDERAARLDASGKMRAVKSG